MKNKLSVWTFPFRKSYYLTHPWKWFKDIYWNIKNSIYRIKFSFGYVDAWNFCEWYPRVGAAALRYIAKYGSGYPGDGTLWDTPEKWREHLLTIAQNLDICADSMDILYTDKNNEYAEDLHKKLDSLPYHREELPNGCIRTWHDEDEEYKQLQEKYWKRTEEISNELHNFRKNVFTNLGEMIERYWD